MMSGIINGRTPAAKAFLSVMCAAHDRYKNPMI